MVPEGCDDENLVNSDGCSATCAVEFGWACITQTKPTVVPSFCYELSWPKIIDYFIENNNVLLIEFNETTKLDSTWTTGDYILNITGPFEPYNFTWELYQSNSLMLSPNKIFYFNLTINN